MTARNLPSHSSNSKSFPGGSREISFHEDINLYLLLSKPEPGGRKTEELVRIIGIRIGDDGQAYAKYNPNGCSGLFFRCVPIGKIIDIMEENA